MDISEQVRLEELEERTAEALDAAEKANIALKESLENQQAMNEELTASYETQQSLNEELMAMNDNLSKEQEKLQHHLQVIQGLGDEYFSILLVNFENNHVMAYRTEGEDGQDIAHFLNEGLDKWTEFASAYVERTVLSEDREAFYDSLSKVAKEMPDHYSHVYRKLRDGGISYLEARLIMVKDEKGRNMGVIGTRAVDNILAEIRMNK